MYKQKNLTFRLFPVAASLVAVIALLFISQLSFAQLPPPTEDDGNLFPAQNHYSPYAGRAFPTEVFWGDTHLHTGNSMDAGAFGARLLPEDAHRFARGEEVTSSTGLKVKLSRPLDFLVVADHSDNMGFFPLLNSGDPKMLADPTGRRWYDMIQAGGQEGVAAAVEIIQALTGNSFPDALYLAPGTSAYRTTWDQTIAAAEKYNEPGVYTALHGYEWTSTENGANRHRVVVYRDGASKVGMMEPYTTLPPYGSPDERELWKWLESYEDKTGGSIFAIAHNGNLSNGAMFPVRDTFTGKRYDREWAETRAKWEPIYEITQIKGDGETHPFLSPNDEFADYEIWDQGNLDLSEFKKDEMLQYEYGRSALGIGMELQKKLGVNPYKVGFIGSTDSHTGLATAQEDNFFGKHSGAEPNPKRVDHPMAKVGDAEYPGWSMVASGLAAVWARENTREALFDAMENKETYSTSGSRMLVRFFGGWDFTGDDSLNRLIGTAGYEKGVPMGGDLTNAPAGKAPSFLVGALRDPLSGNLDRIQIIKVWVDKSGERQEKVFDVVWSGDRAPGSDGKLPSVGNTVDVANATWTNSIGSPELITVWSDPEFDPKLSAAYYARVLEIPTPRWTAYEGKRFGIEIEEGIPMVTVERAITSPIWYTPAE
ncbi:MAG: DUF3604 domain-containing protein [Gammaproteobacteria bacterium]|nr:DUF3604 domain-containing protein [Gammaproteobacteria bacterium]